jgi:hypothetical protein
MLGAPVLRCRQVGHSTLSLGAHIGASAAMIRSFEGRVSPDMYPFGVLSRYASALGCDIDDLFEPGRDGSADSDAVAQVVATMVAAGGHMRLDAAAAALAWTPEETRDTLRAADTSLRPIGLRIAWHGDAAVTLTTAAPTGPIARNAVAASGLTAPQARLLASLASAGRLTRTDDRVATSALLDAGLVEHSTSNKSSTCAASGVRAAVRLTAEAKYNRCL